MSSTGTTSLNTALRTHIAFNIWASQQLLEAASKLSPEQRERDFGTADRSIFGTLLHLYRSERTWLQRLQHGTALHDWKLPEDESWEAVTRGWAAVHDEWRAWASSLGESDPDRMINYNDWKQRAWSQPMWQIVLHMVNHSTHHRGQVMGFLRILGTTPPPIDYILYIRQQAASV